MRLVAVNSSSKRKLVDKLKGMGEILRFGEEPLIASLCTCLALDFEIGNPEFDRFSAFLGVDDLSLWKKTIFTADGEVGIELMRTDGKSLRPMHSDLRFLLDASSMNEAGELYRAVIYPRRVAAHYAQRGFQLVIVRDWILSTALSLDEKTVGYLLTNEWEIRNHIAYTQSQLMLRHEIPFFGTHDIVDHLFGLVPEGYDALRGLHQRTGHVLGRYFYDQKEKYEGSRPHLLLSYLIGVALDDLAQPRWYGSQTHSFVIDQSLKSLSKLKISTGPLDLPNSFHHLATIMRERTAPPQKLANAMNAFTTDLSFELPAR